MVGSQTCWGAAKEGILRQIMQRDLDGMMEAREWAAGVITTMVGALTEVCDDGNKHHFSRVRASEVNVVHCKL